MMETNYNEDSTAAIIKHDLSRNMPLRVVIRRTDNNIEGLVENSFTMEMSPYRVRIWWSGRAYSMLGEHIIDGISDAQHNAKEGDEIFDPLSDDCPITIDWQAWKTAKGKYEQRNAPFRIKNGTE